jgi:hypothetical protein
MRYVALLNGLLLLRLAVAGAVRLQRQVDWQVLMALLAFAAFRREVGCDWPGDLNQFIVAPCQAARTPPLSPDGRWWRMLTQIREDGLADPWVNVVSSAIFHAGVHGLARRHPTRWPSRWCCFRS